MTKKRLTPISEETLKKIARYLHNQGVEITPEDVDSNLRNIIDKVKLSLRRNGFTPPDDDLEMLEIIRTVMSGDI